MMTHQVAIIGAGPAGIACALQLKRHGITPLLLERDAVGGLLRNANLVENYPGFPRGIKGLQLVELFKAQLQTAGVEVIRECVHGITYGKNSWSIKADGRVVFSKVVVLACGTKPSGIADPVIPSAIADRVFYEVYPLINLQDKTVVIIGAGDAAFDYALNLAEKNEVIILNRSKKVSALPLLYNRSRVHTRITYLAETQVEEITLRCGRISLSCSSGQEQRVIDADYLLIAVGREPCLDVFGGELTDKYQRLINEGKLYLIGDVKNGMFRQTAISVGDGIKAAMAIAVNAGEQK